MAFIGNTNTTQAFTPAIDYISGTGSATAFTLSRPVASVAQVQVTIDNVAQNPSSAYTVSGSTITFTSAPLSGTNNIYVYYTSPITQVIAPGQGTVGTTALVDASVTTAKLASTTGSGAVVLGTSPTLTTPNIDSAQVATVSGTAPLYMCRAWVNFNGTGTVAIRASGNVSSITDNGAGDYTVNFTTAMPDANCSVAGSAKESDSGTTDALFKIAEVASNPAAGSVRVISGGALTAFDCNTVMVSVFR
jgi:hypothetical protein